MPVTLEELGIAPAPALDSLCSEFQSNTKIKTDFVSHGVSDGLKDKLKTYLYRISQEALNNISKHAGASEVNLQLLGNSEQVNLIIQDNGKGFAYSPEKIWPGNGLNNIKDRVEILGGTFSLDSVLGKGTTLNIKIPLK